MTIICLLNFEWDRSETRVKHLLFSKLPESALIRSHVVSLCILALEIQPKVNR